MPAAKNKPAAGTGNWDDFAKNLQLQVDSYIKNANLARDEAERARSKAEADRNIAQVRFI